MKLRVARLLGALVIAAGLFVLLWYLVFAAAEMGFSMLLGRQMMDGFWPPVAWLILLASAIVGVDIYQLLNNRLHVRFFTVQALVYCVLLAAVVLFKSRGVQELNLDFFDLYTSIIEYPASVAVNALLFASVGALVLLRAGGMARALVLGLALVVGIEVVQYLLHLGICDVVDVLVCYGGYLLGCLCLNVLRGFGLHLVRDGGAWVRIERQPPQCLVPGKDTLVTALLLAVLVVGCIAGAAFYDYDDYKYVPWENANIALING